MYDPTRNLLLRWLKVPPEPHAPFGDPASLRVFRAGQNYFKLKLVRWGLAQLLAFAGIVFWLAVFLDVELEVDARRRAQAAPAQLTAESFAKTMEKAGQEVGAGGARKKGARGSGGFAGFKRGLAQIALQFPPWVFPLLWVLKTIGIIVYFVQLPITYLIARMDFELRWYMVTDRSLRIRHGVWKVAEATMSFANIQQVEVSQGPIQRLLGVADVQVQSAGGGRSGPGQHQKDESMHTGLFHSVTNATEIRDLILDRLRHFRQSGLGDPEEAARQAQAPHPVAIAAAVPADSTGLLAAARELRDEAKALRAALG